MIVCASGLRIAWPVWRGCLTATVRLPASLRATISVAIAANRIFLSLGIVLHNAMCIVSVSSVALAVVATDVLS